MATSGKYLEARVKKSSFFRFLARYYSLAFSSGFTLALFGFPLSGSCFLFCLSLHQLVSNWILHITLCWEMNQRVKLSSCWYFQHLLLWKVDLGVVGQLTRVDWIETIERIVDCGLWIAERIVQRANLGGWEHNLRRVQSCFTHSTESHNCDKES